MFFVLSKVLHWCIDPLVVCFVLSCITLLFYRRRAMRWLLAFAVLLLYVASAPAGAGLLVQWVEGPYPPATQLRHYDVAIVLTGMVRQRAHIRLPGYLEFNGHVERILAGISLVKRGVADKLLIVGGSGDPWSQGYSEARHLRPFAVEFGLTEEQILTEERSRNTYENAVNAAEIIRAKGFTTLLLVTSAFHMARSEGVFHAQGLFPDLYPVDFGGRGRELVFDYVPSVQALSTTTLMIHELVGVLMYRFQGYL